MKSMTMIYRLYLQFKAWLRSPVIKPLWTHLKARMMTRMNLCKELPEDMNCYYRWIGNYINYDPARKDRTEVGLWTPGHYQPFTERYFELPRMILQVRIEYEPACIHKLVIDEYHLWFGDIQMETEYFNTGWISAREK